MSLPGRRNTSAHGLMPEIQREARRSPCCHARPSQARPITDRYGWAWALHTCGVCGIQYQARPMTDAARQDFYASGQYRRLCAAVTGKPWDDPVYLRAEQISYAAKWDDRVPYLTGRVLDYGGSTGVVSQRWARGPLSMPAVTVADYGDGATTTPEQALAVPDATYDAILCCQTLDHVDTPLETLEAFLRVAKPGARLFCDIVKLSHTAYKIDHSWYSPSAAPFLALIERSGWVPLWLDGETNPSHWSVLAEKPNG